MKIPTFSIIGTGFIMPRHAEAIYHVGGKIIDIVNTAHGENAWRNMVKNTVADCIVILTPNDLHFPMIKAAVEAGKTVLCEKPLGLHSKEIKELINYPNIFAVLQLKYHPEIEKLKNELNPNKHHQIEIDISVYRDEKYYKSWKGQKVRSGGVLFNLGIHYFDLIIQLFGAPEKIIKSSYSDKTGEGIFMNKNYTCNWHISTDEKKDNQRRVFKIDGTTYNFSSKDNLSYENLHQYVYKDLIDKKGITPKNALPAIALIENIYKISS